MLKHFFVNLSCAAACQSWIRPPCIVEEIQRGFSGKFSTRECKGRFSLASKANPFMHYTLTAEGMTSQLDQSLASLRLTQGLDIFYLHGPDANVNIEETLGAVQAAFEAGKFKRLALSNFTAWETCWIHMYMKQKGWVVPEIYQGMYNAITRSVEAELFLCLRRLGMVFFAYNPLAGGMLTGKHKRGGDTGAGRFTNDTPWGKIYQQRFMQEKQFDAVDVLKEACAAAGDIALAEASLRWLRYHSKLGGSDGIIIGASSIRHYEQNMLSLSKVRFQKVSFKHLTRQLLCAAACALHSPAGTLGALWMSNFFQFD